MMNKELEILALNGDEDALKQLRGMASQRDETLIIMHRLLQAHFYSHDAVSWHLDTVIWSPWHGARPEPGYFVDADSGKAFRTIKIEKKIVYIDSKLLDPEEIPHLLEKGREKQASDADLQEMMEEAIKTEEYEKAAKIRDEIKSRLEAKKA